MNDQPRSGRLIFLIGIFKLLKAAVLLLTGVGALTIVPAHIASWTERVALWLGTAPGHHVLRRALERLSFVDHEKVRELGALAIGYAVVFLIEGSGILRRKVWAEWLTAGVTASFIPIEVYELAIHFGGGKVAGLLVNVAIATYLFVRRWRASRAR